LGRSSDVLAAQRGAHELRKKLRRARKGRSAERAELGRELVIECRGAFVAQRQQHHELYSGGQNRRDALEQLLLHAAFEEIADQDHHRIGRRAHESLTVGDRAVDVGASAELRREQ
jgi:hypothetical protein